VNNGLSLVEDLFTRIIGPFGAAGITPLLFEPDNVEDRVKLLLATFNQHPQYIPPFQILIKSLNPQDREVPLEENIRFYTTAATRLWLITLLINHTLNLKELQLDFNTGKIASKPGDVFKYALEARANYGEDSRYKDHAFAAGLLFDFCLHLSRTQASGGTKIDEPINQAFKRGVEQGQVLIKISKYKKKLAQERLTPLMPLIRQLAQVSLHLLKPSESLEFYKKLSSLKHTEPVRLAMELNTFGVHTGMLACFLSQMIPEFSPMDSAFSVWGAPYLSHIEGLEDVHDLSAMGLLGVSLKERLRGSDFTGTGHVGAVIPELFNLEMFLTAEVKSETQI
jgi:hypothetical protein